MKVETKIAKFEAGKTYAAKKSKLFDSQFTITVIKRTECYVHFQFDDGELDETIYKRKVVCEHGVEKVYYHETNALDGDYEFSAKDVVEPEINADEYAISEEAQDAAVEAEIEMAAATVAENKIDEDAEKFYRETASTYRKMQAAAAFVHEFLTRKIFDIYDFDYALSVRNQRNECKACPNKFHLVDTRFDVEVDRNDLEYVIYYGRTELARYHTIESVTNAVDQLVIAIVNHRPEFTFPADEIKKPKADAEIPVSPETKESLREKAAKLGDLKERLDKEKSFTECAREHIKTGQTWMRAAGESGDTEFYRAQIAATGATISKLNERIADLTAQMTAVEKELETVNQEITTVKKAA